MAHRADTPDDDIPDRVRHGRARDRRQQLVVVGVVVAVALGLLALAACGGLALWWLRPVAPQNNAVPVEETGREVRHLGPGTGRGETSQTGRRP